MDDVDDSPAVNGSLKGSDARCRGMARVRVRARV